MTAPTDFQLSPPGSTAKLESALRLGHDNGLHELGAELVFTQNAAGQYLSFYWQEAERYGLQPEEIAANGSLEIFGPVEIATYLQRVRQVLENLVPERWRSQFRYGERELWLELMVSPILRPDGTATAVLVMGRQLAQEECDRQSATPTEIEHATPSSVPHYQKLLTQIARNIRRTLDLDTIWQQTVNGLGQALGASRCLICAYKCASAQVPVVEEYRQEQFPSMLGRLIAVADQPAIERAIATLEPVVERPENDRFGTQSALVAVTCYQDQPNGLIILHQCDRPRLWSVAEIELVRDLADQVGTAIAHATLYKDLEEAREQAEEASRLKSEFLATTTHELRTPLNGMIGFLKLIIDGMADDPEEESQFIEEAYRSALHLLNIINDILDIAKIEAGKMELDLGLVQLDELFGDVEDFMRAQAQQKKLNFRVQLPAIHDRVTIYGNYQRLLQVMLNLVGNAIKFTHEGGVTISAEIQKKKVVLRNQEFPGWVRIRVADTGIGVSLDKQDKLFQKFTQVDGGLNRQYGGTGLGLTISQKLIEAMGGVVNFYSMGEGLGSTVTFTVPLYQDPVMISTQ